ncbi:hypothetical protein FB567DRAFT_553575 [Paraphoma chrysanthemicola]|uniref:Uncharacterized protein n=1 Tax=Paraphoma chrysanthemicola TaxID=798071 RepID=A0A8K0VTC9_9PLEO|nr:hypothetical protein FB567DRAFT_553575 [Paraphoma chrysanthemicola]
MEREGGIMEIDGQLETISGGVYSQSRGQMGCHYYTSGHASSTAAASAKMAAAIRTHEGTSSIRHLQPDVPMRIRHLFIPRAPPQSPHDLLQPNATSAPPSLIAITAPKEETPEPRDRVYERRYTQGHVGCHESNAARRTRRGHASRYRTLETAGDGARCSDRFEDRDPAIQDIRSATSRCGETYEGLTDVPDPPRCIEQTPDTRAYDGRRYSGDITYFEVRGVKPRRFLGAARPDPWKRHAPGLSRAATHTVIASRGAARGWKDI